MEATTRFRFVHIPKTAGITFSLVLLRRFKGQKKLPVYLPEQRRQFREKQGQLLDQYDLVYGHFPFPSDFASPEGLYFTFLRNPDDRLLSRYKHFMQQHSAVEREKKGIHSLEDFLTSGIVKHADNCMTRFLSGNTDKQFGAITQEDLDKAIHHLDHHFPIFGITERFDESLSLLSMHAKWPPLLYAKANVSAYKVDPFQLTEKAKAAMRRNNQYDYELYAHACKRFDALVESRNEQLQEEVKKLRERNRKFRVILTARNKANLLAAKMLRMLS